jgi:hypothetical protein
MAVVHHALRWSMSEAACAAAAAVAERARAGDSAGLSALAHRFHREAARFPATLAAFDLADREHLSGWLAADIVHPALATLLAWAPGLVPLGDRDAGALAALYRRGGSPARPLAETGDSFLPLARALGAAFGRSPLDSRPSRGQLGHWARAGRLERRLRRLGDDEGAGQVAAMAGPDPDQAWLVTSTIW